MKKRTILSTISTSLLWATLLILSQACERAKSVREIGPSRPEAVPEKAHKGVATDAERLGFQAAPDRARPSAGASSGRPEPVYDLPAGWSVLPSSQFVMLKLRVAGSPDATCHLSILGGNGGGLLANVNRWYNQMGLPPISAADVAKLPTHKFFNSRALLLDLTGSYAGMGADKKEDWGLIGLILVAPRASLFLKMQGPAALLKKEKQHFLDLASSFRWKNMPNQSAGAHGDGSSGAAASQPSSAGAKGGLKFDKPASWTSQPGSQFRLINFKVGSDGTECYVSQSGGGLLPNLNRWRGQMGLKPMGTTELTRLSSMRVLGVEVPLLEIEGPFKGMRGPKIEKAGMLATYVATQGTSYAIKLTGPIESVRAAKKDFVKFVQSLRAR